MLILPVCEHDIYLHLFVLSSISFIGVLQFSEYRSFTNSLGRFIHNYFIPSDVIVNTIVSLVSLSDSSLLVNRNAIGFCVLILYPATLSNSMMSSSSFVVVSLEFSQYSIISSAEFYFFLSSLDSFYFFFFSDCCG